MTAIGWLDGALAVRLTLALVHFLWQGCAVALVVLVAGRVLRGRSANLRYAVHVAALLMLAACLPMTLALTAVPDTVGKHEAMVTVAPPLEQIIAERNTVEEVAPEDRALPAKPSPPKHASGQVLVPLLERIAPFSTGLYVLGVAIMLARLGCLLWGGHRMRLSAEAMDDDAMLALIERTAHAIGLKTAPAVAWCRRVSVPVVVGFVKPMILLPVSLASGLAPSQLEALLLHELAHIRRYDALVNLLQRLTEAVLFFHPAVWYVSRRVSIEREHACDDVVLAAGCGRVAYADALVRMAELCTGAGLSGHAALLAAAGSSRSQFHRRVLRLLEAESCPKLRLTRGGVVAIACVITSLLITPAIVQTWADHQVEQASAVPESDKAKAVDDQSGRGDEQVPDPEVREAFQELIAAKNWRERSAASKKLGELGPRALPTLLEGTQHENDDARESCYLVLWDKFPTEPAAIDAFLRGLKDKGDSAAAARIRYSCAFSLGSHTIARASDALRDVYDHDNDLRLTAAKSLAQLGHIDVIGLLYDQLASDHYMQRYQANLGIKALTGRDLDAFGDYDWREGAFVSGGREYKRIGRYVEDAETKAKRFRAIAEFHKWLKRERPKLAALLSPQDEKEADSAAPRSSVERSGRPRPNEDNSANQIPGIDLADYPSTREAATIGDLYRPDPENPGRYRSAGGVLTIPIYTARHYAILKYPVRLKRFYVQVRAPKGGRRTYGPIEGDPFEKLKLDEAIRAKLRVAERQPADALLRLRQILSVGDDALRARAFAMMEEVPQPVYRDRHTLDSLIEVASEALEDTTDPQVATQGRRALERVEQLAAAAKAEWQQRRVTLDENEYAAGESGDPGPSIVWGQPAENGMQLGIGADLDPASWEFEKSYDGTLWVRNTGKEPVKFTSTSRTDEGVRLWLVDAAGERHEYRIGGNTSWLVPLRYRLEPRQWVKLKKVWFSAKRAVEEDERRPPVGRFSVEPGRYALEVELRIAAFESYDAEGNVTVPAAGEWTGTLTAKSARSIAVGANAGKDGPKDEQADARGLNLESNKRNNVSNTRAALEALRGTGVVRAKREDDVQQAIERGIRYLRTGEGKRPSMTTLGIASLLAGGAPEDSAVRRALEWLRSQQRAATEATPAAGPASLEVHVAGVCRRAEDDAPLAGAEARLYVSRRHPSRLELFKTARTNRDGKFVIEGKLAIDGSVNLRRSRICVVAPGRAARVFFWQPDSDYNPPVELKLEPPASLKGRVVGPDGQPVAGALVYAGGPWMQGVHDAVTDEHGRYEIDDMEAWNGRESESFLRVGNLLQVMHADFDEERVKLTAVPSTVDMKLTTRRIEPKS